MSDPRPRIAKVVAAAARTGAVTLYFHDGGSFRTESLPFRPFVLAAAEQGGRLLEGSAPLNRLLEFDSAAAQKEALKSFREQGVAVFSYREPVTQALVQNDVRLFEQMEPDELRILVIDFDPEAVPLGRIELGDNRQWRCTLTAEPDEPALLRKLGRIVAERDPDLIVGHELCDRLLPALLGRAKACKVALDWGRDGSGFTRRASRYTAGERTINYTRFDLDGRHLVDTQMLARLYDAIHRDLEAFDPESLGEAFELEGDRITLLGKLVDLLLPSYFYRASILPLSLQDVIVRGNGVGLDALLVAENLKRGFSVPLPEAPQTFAGALTRSERSGVFHNVWHCDVRSLYPSILLMLDRAPRRDECGIFLAWLRRLRDFRLRAKDLARSAGTPEQRRHYAALQSAFKILINSFYGYLGFAQGSFNDYGLAAEVTRTGREILTSMLDYLVSRGANVIEMDTDGIYFQAPPDAGRPEQFEAAVQSVLAPGIEIELDSVNPAMFSYKSKNYALLTSDGEVRLTGAALKSRALEPFQRQVIREIVTALLQGTESVLPERFAFWHRAIAEHTLPLAMLAKCEVLNDSPENYRRKLEAGSGRRSAAYELALHSERRFRSGDKICFYVTGSGKRVSVVENAKLLDETRTGRDENVEYYLAKLEELRKGFAPFLEGKIPLV